MRIATFGLVIALGCALSGSDGTRADDDVTLSSLTAQGFEVKASFLGTENDTVYFLQKGQNVFRCSGRPMYAWDTTASR